MYKWVLKTFCLFAFPFLVCAQAEKDSLNFVQFRYENGQVSSEGTMKNGVPDGYWKSYHRNGNLKTEGNRVNNKLDDVWKFYDEEGVITVSIEYKENLKNGKRITYEGGVPIKEEIFESDKKEGLTTLLFPNGKSKKVIPFIADREQGLGYEYAEDQRIITINTYKNGVQVKEQKINRKDDKSRRQGLWIHFYDNMQPKDEGLYVNDLKHGYWKYYQQTGNLIRTEKWIMGVLQEDSKEISKVDVRRTLDPKTGRIAAIGAYLNGKKEGVHRQYNANGDVTGSQFYKEDRVLAEGIFDEQGRRQGPWKYYYWEGELKEFGDYKDNNKVGQWKYLFQDGNMEQQGNYASGKPTGAWKWFYNNGELRREMEYVNGEPDGPSFEYDEQGNIVSEGEYVDGFKEGAWRYVYGDIIETGTYFEGEQNGTWTQVDRLTGILLYESNFVTGEKNGKFTWYYENGNVYRRGVYEMGKREGIWETFDEFGNLTFTIEYQNGKEIKYNGKRITYGKRVDRALAAEEEND